MAYYNNGISKNIKLLYNTPYQQSKFRTKNWAEINSDRVECITPIVKLWTKVNYDTKVKFMWL